MPEAAPSDSMKLVLSVTMILYVAVMFGVCLLAQKRIENVDDFVVAGRRLPLSLAWATLLATWFGAGTMLTASTEVARVGIRKAALDPVGAGLCLIIAGMFYARPLWNMGLMTISDFFRVKFGARAETVSALVMIPSFFGWIAAQFVALGLLLEFFFGIPLAAGVILVAAVGTSYTLMGGMWSVTLTDALQIVLVIVGLVVLTFSVLSGMGDGNVVAGFLGVFESLSKTQPEKLCVIPTESPDQFWNWVGLLCAGALGNLSGQDLLQRIFSAKSDLVAQQACWLAGTGYLVLGMLPILLGLAAASHFGSVVGDSVIPALSHAFLHPLYMVVFVVVLLSVVLSTIDSAILAPATVMAQNLIGRKLYGKASGFTLTPLQLNRACVIIVAVASVAMALSGRGAYELLENAYSLPLVGLFVPLTLGLYTKPRGEAPAVTAMAIGVFVWLPQYLLGWSSFLQELPVFCSLMLPLSLSSVACALAAYLFIHYRQVLAERAA